ncbi:MAG: hypothetical protein JXQ67_09475 [Campylobacterales bacterium]|nr:hypothetical protein [Campylobacterales bacterium]
MHYKYQINSDEKECLDFLLDIESNFLTNEQSIHKARNELKIIACKEKSTVVKSFKVPHLLNKIVYTFFRDTKAKKSYEYSLKIENFTPKPIGYIEFYNFFLLTKSYFVSENFNYDFTIREPLLDENFENREAIFKAFATFTYTLHQDNILHQDYSPGNILIKKDENNYIFKVVDINRMKFKELNLSERMQNFSKLWASDEALSIMLKEYAKVAHEDERKCLMVGLEFSRAHKKRKNFKKRLKGECVVD